ncbi:hypothetical protein GCM10025779_28560 [Arthrobacter cryoconiti]
MEEFLDDDLKAMLNAKLELLPSLGQPTTAGEMAARAHLLGQIIELFYDSSKHRHAGPGERDGLAQVLDAAKAHEMKCLHLLREK